MQFTDTKEFHELIAEFEKLFSHMQPARQAKEVYHLQSFYKQGQVNRLFIAYMHGYMLARNVYLTNDSVTFEIKPT